MRFIIGLVVVAVLLVAGAYLLPRNVSVARSTLIEAAPETVFPLVNSLQQGQKWSPWLSLDPQVMLTYSGPEAGVGNTLGWSSDHPNVGSGKQVITASEPDRHVATSLDFGDMGSARAAFDLEPEGTGTKITWSFETDMGMNPMGRWMGLMMDRWVGADYEKGLANLKALAESR